MKKYLSVILFTYMSFVYSQNLKISYDHYYKLTESPVSLSKKSELEITATNSLYKIIMSSDGVARKKSMESEGDKIIVIGEGKPRNTYKDLINKTLINTEKILLTEFVVTDSLNIFNWKLEDDDVKIILGYKCNKASLNYRGRKYEAYYAVEIPLQNGPWKFHGLPGLILEIKTIEVDLDFRITATKIEDIKTNIEIVNPFEKEKTHTWQDFVELYKKKYKELSDYSGDDGTSVSIPKAKIEVMIED